MYNKFILHSTVWGAVWDFWKGYLGEGKKEVFRGTNN